MHGVHGRCVGVVCRVDERPFRINVTVCPLRSHVSLDLRVSLHGSKTKENPKSSNPIGRGKHLDLVLYTMVWFQDMKERGNDENVASLSC